MRTQNIIDQPGPTFDPIDEGVAALERAMQSRAAYLSLKAQTEAARVLYQADVRDLRLLARQLGAPVRA